VPAAGVCRALGVPVVHAYVNRKPAEIAARVGQTRFVDDFRAAGDSHSEPNRLPDRLEGTPQAEVVPALVRDGDIHVRSKKTTDPFLGTELEILMARALRPTTAIILGINTETCVHMGAFACSVRGYRPVVASDCVGSHRGAVNTWLSLELLSRTIAWVLPSEQIVAKLREGRS
jgi:nicotinamidase-related amidase